MPEIKTKEDNQIYIKMTDSYHIKQIYIDRNNPAFNEELYLHIGKNLKVKDANPILSFQLLPGYDWKIATFNKEEAQKHIGNDIVMEKI